MLAALAAVFAAGLPPLTTFSGKKQRADASHVCHNKMYVNSAHIVFESRERNQRRYGCRNGNARQCQCDKLRCVWVLEGRILPCRNDPTKRECNDDCKLRCFGKFDFQNIRFPFSLFAEHALNILDLAENQQVEDDAPLEMPDEDEDDGDLASPSEDEEPANKRVRVGDI